MSDEMRLIEEAEETTPGEQPPMVLSWDSYKALVHERDGLGKRAVQYLREKGDALRALEMERAAHRATAERLEEARQELREALDDLRHHGGDYLFEKHYGRLAVDLGMEHEFKYFPVVKE